MTTVLYLLAGLAADLALLAIACYLAVNRDWLDPDEPVARVPLTAVDPQTSAVSFSRPAVKGFDKDRAMRWPPNDAA